MKGFDEIQMARIGAFLRYRNRYFTIICLVIP
jgi:hypothetical protein